jgi:hypothetical protein
METATSVLDLIGAMPSSTRGTLLFGEDASSSVGVFISNGSVCWASATRDGRTLVSYLRRRAHLTLGDDEIEAVQRHCCRRGLHLGEELVRRGAVTHGGLAAALLSQAMDAFRIIEQGIGSPFFVPSEQEPPRHRIEVAALQCLAADHVFEARLAA